MFMIKPGFDKQLLCFCCFLLIALSFAALFEVQTFVYISNFVFFAYIAVVTLLCSPFLFRKTSTSYWIIYGLFLVALYTFHVVLWDSRKSFVRDLYSIKPNMTRTQVKTIMASYIKKYGVVASGQDIALRHADENNGAYNGDIGIVQFKNDRVVDVKFSPD